MILRNLKSLIRRYPVAVVLNFTGLVAAVDFCTIFAKNLMNQKKSLYHLIDQVVKGGIGIVERRSLFFIGSFLRLQGPASGK
jgi:hypothetical protein